MLGVHLSTHDAKVSKQELSNRSLNLTQQEVTTPVFRNTPSVVQHTILVVCVFPGISDTAAQETLFQIPRQEIQQHFQLRDPRWLRHVNRDISIRVEGLPFKLWFMSYSLHCNFVEWLLAIIYNKWGILFEILISSFDSLRGRLPWWAMRLKMEVHPRTGVTKNIVI